MTRNEADPGVIPWSMITGVADSAILMPVALIIAIWLLVGKLWRLAGLWCLLFGCAMLAVIATKIAFLGWGIGSQALDFTGISGHAARAAAIFPVLFYLCQRKPPRVVFSGAAVLGWLFAVVISISRVKVHAHSVSEAVSGFALGALVSLFFILAARNSTTPKRHGWLLVACLLLMPLAPFIKPAPAQQWIVYTACYLSGRDQPFDRAMWYRSASTPAIDVSRD